MKILIIDDNGREIFNRTLLGEYRYDKTGDALHAAILLEAAWKLQRPGSPPRINNGDIFKPSYHPYDQGLPQPSSQSEPGEGEAPKDMIASRIGIEGQLTYSDVRIFPDYSKDRFINFLSPAPSPLL